MNFNSFDLKSVLLSNITELGYETPTPIQQQSIPPILSGHDVMGLAQTGTGKTAAFALPILQKLLENPGASVRALVIACPGRLLDHLQQRTIDLSKVEMLVLDEADQMFDMGFLPSIRKILRYLPKKRQTLLFSATMPAAIHDLAHDILHKPIKFEIGRVAPATSVEQMLFPITKNLKTELLIHLLHKIKKESVLVFTRTKHTAKKVAMKLEQAGFRATSLQGNLSQNKRMSTMNGFRDGSLQILVATDIASRGIDVSSISHVINYDIPETVETYIHRIGRTGRAAKEGEAFTLITNEDQKEVRAIERVLGKKLECREFDDFNYKAAGPVRNLMRAATKKPTQQRKRRQ